MERDLIIDGFRGISVCMVVCLHALLFVPVAVLPPEAYQAFVDATPMALVPMFGFDRSLEIFFLISAYVLTRPLLYQIEGGGLSLRRYAIVRLLRIYPVYLFLLALLYLIDQQNPFAGDEVATFLQNLFFLDNLFDSSIIAVTWSLTVEMQFYLILPFLILFAYWTGRPFAVLLGFFVVSLVVRGGVLMALPSILLPASMVDILQAEGMKFLYYNTCLLYTSPSPRDA